jgi:hypothetical protein
VLTAVEASDWRLIRKHRRRAVFIAMERLNKSIDRGDRQGRDFWAQVVHEIHDYERSRELAVKEPPVDGRLRYFLRPDRRASSREIHSHETD